MNSNVHRNAMGTNRGGRQLFMNGQNPANQQPAPELKENSFDWSCTTAESEESHNGLAINKIIQKKFAQWEMEAADPYGVCNQEQKGEFFVAIKWQSLIRY